MRSTPRAPARSFVRARCSSTRWLPSESPSRSHTSSAPKPSTSRSVTTRRCILGQLLDRLVDLRHRLGRERDLLGAAAPRADRRGPVARARLGGADEALGIHRRPVLVVAHERRERRRARLAHATGAGEVHHDAKEVGAQRRAALERVEPAQEAEPGFLGDVLGDLLGRHVLTRDAHERGVVAIDEALEGALVAGAQGGQQGSVVLTLLRSPSRRRRYTAPLPCAARGGMRRASDTVDLRMTSTDTARAAPLRTRRRRLVPAQGLRASATSSRADGSSGYQAEAGRYHLYVSAACPWAHRTIIYRHLKGLEDAISMTIVDPERDERGWAITDDARHDARSASTTSRS